MFEINKKQEILLDFWRFCADEPQPCWAGCTYSGTHTGSISFTGRGASCGGIPGEGGHTIEAMHHF